MRDGHCIEDHHGWNIIHFKHPRHTFVSQHLRNVKAKFHKNVPNFGTLLIHLFAGMTHGNFSQTILQFFCGIKKTGNLYFFLKSAFIKLSNDIYFAVLFFKMARIRIFCRRIPTKVRSNLNFIAYFFFCDNIPIDVNMLVFFLGKWVRTAPQNHSCVLYLASGRLRNAANSSVVPTEFAAKLTTMMKSSKANFVTWTFRLPPKRQLSILLNIFFPFIDIWYFFSGSELQHCRTIVLLHWLLKSTTQFPAKKRWYSPSPLGRLGATLTYPQSLYGRMDDLTYVQAYLDVRTKFSRINRFPNGAPLAR